MQYVSKLLKGFPWPIIFKPETTPFGHLACHERRACSSYLAFRSIDSKIIKLFELHFHIA
jgi:hypothetical protein